MKNLAASFSAKALLIGSSACMAAGAFLLFVHVGIVMPRAAIPDDLFMRGQYYFNHDDDPRGPYDLKKAREYYSAAIKEDPEGNPLVWYQLGRIDFIEGRFDSALYKFDKQIEYFGDSIPNVYYMIGLTNGFKAKQTEDAEDWEKAEEGFKEFLLHDPESPWARVDLSWVYFMQGSYEEMVPVLEEGLALYPDNPWLLNMYGLALLNTGKREAAHDEFVHAAETAAALTTEEWGRAYPGNDPALWGEGLQSFKDAIAHNRALTDSE